MMCSMCVLCVMCVWVGADGSSELVFSLHHFSGALRAEWEALAPHDVVFLLGLADPDAGQSAESAAAAAPSFGQRYGLRHLRGAEILEIWDEQGARVRAREQKRAGQLRRLVVALDCAQYYTDVKANRFRTESAPFPKCCD